MGPVHGATQSVVSLVKSEMAGNGGVMGVVEERKTNVRLLRDADKGVATTRNAKKTIDQTVAWWYTSLEAAFVDGTEFGVIRVAVYKALPQAGVQLDGHRVNCEGRRIWFLVIRSS
jgi:hypothetical protein